MRAMALTAAILMTASALQASDPQELFNRARGRVLANLDRTPRYTCMQTIDREVRRTVRSAREACAPTPVNAAASGYGERLWRDRVRLDVAVINGTETFAWAGARRFETEAVDKLVGSGATATGDFASFLASIFGSDGRQFRYTGEQSMPSGLAARFEFAVPLATTHYRYRVRGEFKTVPYFGWFLINSATAALEHLSVVVTELDPDDEVCRIEDTIDYETARIGNNDFILPRLSRMNAVYRAGKQAINETHYSGCHEYSAQSTIRFDDDSQPETASSAEIAVARQPLPEGIRLDLALETPIDGTAASAGDEVIAESLRDVHSKSAVILRRGDRFHGRILRIEQYFSGAPRWNLIVRFDSVVRGGIETPVSLTPVDEGIRAHSAISAHEATIRQLAIPDHPAGSGFFAFFGPGDLKLDSHFHSAWLTSLPAASAQVSAAPLP